MGVPDGIELPESVSKNATRSRSSDVGGKVIVEATRAGVLGLIRVTVAGFVCKHPRNRKGDRDALEKAFLATLVSINHPYVSGERDPRRTPTGQEKTSDQSRSKQSKAGCTRDLGPVPSARIEAGPAKDIEETNKHAGGRVWRVYNYHCLIMLPWSWNVYEGVWGMYRM